MSHFVWTQQMGPAPKKVNVAVSSHVRKPVQVGDTLLFIATVRSCVAVLPALNAAMGTSARAGECTAVVRSRSCLKAHSQGVVHEQRALFQYLFVEGERSKRRRGPGRAVLESFDIGEQLQQRPSIRTEVAFTFGAQGEAQASIVPLLQCAPAEQGEANIVTGPTITGKRGALLLHDGELAFVLNGKDLDEAYHLPSMPVEVGCSAAEAALKAFDILAGSALRRGASGESQKQYESYSLSPQLGSALNKGFEGLVSVGEFGTTEYFACALEPGTLRNYASAFYMARRFNNGWRVTPTTAKKHVAFQLCKMTTALERLQKFDVDAARAALEVAAVTAASQKTGVTMMASLADAQSTGTVSQGGSVGTTGGADVSQHSDTEGDEDFEALWEARVLLTTYAIAEYKEKHGAHDPTDVSQHSDKCAAEDMTACSFPVMASGVAGSAASAEPLTREEIAKMQWEHPHTKDILERLTHGTVGVRPGEEEDDDDFVAELAHHSKSEDGLLLRQTKKGLRIVIPPELRKRVLQQCHDGQGHFGVPKTMEIVSSRFVWANAKHMRAYVSNYIKECDACQRANVHHHKAGRATIPEHGDGPCHTWAMDVYSTGVDADGYTGVLDCMCLFSKLVVAQ